jgi:hypothetical protein
VPRRVEHVAICSGRGAFRKIIRGSIGAGRGSQRGASGADLVTICDDLLDLRQIVIGNPAWEAAFTICVTAARSTTSTNEPRFNPFSRYDVCHRVIGSLRRRVSTPAALTAPTRNDGAIGAGNQQSGRPHSVTSVTADGPVIAQCHRLACRGPVSQPMDIESGSRATGATPIHLLAEIEKHHAELSRKSCPHA